MSLLIITFMFIDIFDNFINFYNRFALNQRFCALIVPAITEC